jgi:hypothetical protein
MSCVVIVMSVKDFGLLGKDAELYFSLQMLAAALLDDLSAPQDIAHINSLSSHHSLTAQLLALT